MKKLASIFLLFSLLYSAFGYYGLLAFEKSQASEMMAADEDATQYKVIKIPVSAYVHLEDRDFEETTGQYEYEGQTYNMVKQRRINDTLEIYALHNERQDQIAAQMNDYVKDQLGGQKGPVGKSPVKQLLKSFLKDYINHPDMRVTRAATGQDLNPPMVATENGFAPSADSAPFAPPPELT